MLESVSLTPNEAARHGIEINRDGRRRTAFELLSRASIDAPAIHRIWPATTSIAGTIMEQLAVDARYASYVERQADDVAVLRRDENIRIPADFDYQGLPGLSVELQQKLARHRPLTVAHAGKIDGITPAALMLILIHVKRSDRRNQA